MSMRALTRVVLTAVLTAAPVCALGQQAAPDRIFEEEGRDGKVIVGIQGCAADVQAEYVRGPGGSSTTLSVKLGFEGVRSPDGERMTIQIDGDMQSLGAGKLMMFEGARGCHMHVDYFAVEIDRDLFLRIAKARSINVLVGQQVLRPFHRDLLRQLARRLESR